jgi:predicted nucleic acid-binding protein
MKATFADTSYFVALCGPRDGYHARALELSENLAGVIVTTEYVLVETAGMLSRTQDRPAFVNLARDLRSDPAVRIVPASSSAFQAGISLFADRSDKEWSLVDCISFTIMRQRRLKDALTSDHHFQQAGFRALLRDEKDA